MTLEERNKQYEQDMTDYNLAKKDFGKYQQNMVNREDYENSMREAREAKMNKCPICGSIDVAKITALNRALSVGTMGLASGKIRKQYKCRNCKHMW